MLKDDKTVFPYIPNSVPEVQEEMLKEIGLDNIDELFRYISDDLKYDGGMDIPEPLLSEAELNRHVEGLLNKNISCKKNLNFLGAGCWQHYVPAVCDEVNQRSEFLTAYAGEPYEDHGRFQASFEYSSMMTELLEMEVVSVPTYDWAQAAATTARMATRITGRKEILISGTVSPERLTVIKNYCRPEINVKMLAFDDETGQMDLKDLKDKISEDTAAVYFENPSYLGFVEEHGQEISDIIHDTGGLSLVGVDPISLGVLTPPALYDADIVNGNLQPLGVHMNYGGGMGGFIASQDKKEIVMEYPLRLFGITETVKEGEYGFGDVAYDRTSFGKREEGKEFVGTMTALWAITAGVYLALMGPQGMAEVGETIMQRSQYAAKSLNEIDGVQAPILNSPFFKEFIVDFSNTDKSVKEINKALLEKGIFGGKDLSNENDQFKDCALLCVTELHQKEDIDRLVTAIKDILNK